MRKLRLMESKQFARDHSCGIWEFNSNILEPKVPLYRAKIVFSQVSLSPSLHSAVKKKKKKKKKKRFTEETPWKNPLDEVPPFPCFPGALTVSYSIW